MGVESRTMPIARPRRVLIDKERALVLIGQLALTPSALCSDIRRLAATLAELTGDAAWLSTGRALTRPALRSREYLPHRGVGGEPLESAGLDAHGMLTSPRHVSICCSGSSRSS